MLFIICFGFTLAFFVQIVRADAWPQWRGPNRDGISKETGWRAEWPSAPEKVWQANVGVGYSSEAIVNGRLYTMGNLDETDFVYCLDANTGKEIWKHDYACSSKDPNGYPGTRCTPTVDGDRVFTVSREGHLFCLSATDGKVLWTKEYKKDFGAKVPTWGFAGSPLVEKNLMLVEPGGLNASVVALNKQTGALVWKHGNDGPGYSSLIAYDYNRQRNLAVFAKEAIVGRAMAGGTELWRFPWKTSYGVNAATPIVVDDKVFISSGYNFGCALLQFSSHPPKVLWQNKNMRNHVNSCVLYQNHLYGFDDNELKCLAFDTGAVKWGNKSFGKGSLMLADGKLIVYSDNGRLAVVEASPESFKQISSAQILGGRSTWSVPVLANGKIYCRSLENLVCLDVKTK
ncbi:MAG TPA: PQQ-binding-like beta-propeller repeat protein [Candidatus Saccharimonadales bacterium]|nr:PQQ-binding-like beta-propeller repeat protein [Candidatus Saccharimonadales bacterium]